MAIKFLNTVQVDTGVLYVNAANDRVGINTQNPGGELQVVGSGSIGNIYLSANAAGSSVTDSLNIKKEALKASIINRDAGDLALGAGGQEYVTIENTGKVGIGTTNPSAKLDIYGNLNLGTTGDFNITQSPFSTATFYIQGGGTGGMITFGAPAATQQNVSVQGDLFTFAGNTSGYLGTKAAGLFSNRLNPSGDNYLNSGKLGIGITSPNAKLDVVQSTGANGEPALHLIGPNTNPGLTSSVLIIEQGDGKKITIDGNDIDVSDEDLFINDYSKEDVTFGGQIKVTGGGSPVGDSYFANGNVGIGSTNPITQLTLGTGSTGVSFQSSAATFNSGKIAVIKPIELGSGNGELVFETYKGGSGGGERMRIDNDGNVGIGTTSPNSTLQVDGEIDADGGDGYRINGKPWAAESSNNLKLGDWDGEGFSTSIFDENAIETFKVKDQGVIINCDRPSTTIYGADSSLVVGGSKFSSWGPGVVTLLNNDPFSIAGDSTGLIQFAIKDDATSQAGYTSASIKGSISAVAGGGTAGGGILDFLTSPDITGASPSIRMRINQSGDVGIGVSSVRAKLHVNGGIKLGNDTGSASAAKSGTFRYYTSGNNSYVDMCMQTGASTYAWVNIVTNSW